MVSNFVFMCCVCVSCTFFKNSALFGCLFSKWLKERKGTKLEEWGGSGSSLERGDHDQNILYKKIPLCVCALFKWRI